MTLIFGDIGSLPRELAQILGITDDIPMQVVSVGPHEHKCRTDNCQFPGETLTRINVIPANFPFPYIASEDLDVFVLSNSEEKVQEIRDGLCAGQLVMVDVDLSRNLHTTDEDSYDCPVDTTVFAQQIKALDEKARATAQRLLDMPPMPDQPAAA